MWGFKVGDERTVKKLFALWVKNFSEYDTIRLGGEDIILDQRADVIERAFTAEAYDAYPASPRRRGERDDGIFF